MTSSDTSKKPRGNKGTSGLPLSIIAVATVVAFLAGVCVCLVYLGHWHARWDDKLDWSTIASLIGAVLNAAVLVIVGWTIAWRLQQKQAGQAFKRELISGLINDSLASTNRVHDYVLECRRRKAFDEEDRERLVLLLTELAQGILLIQDSLEAMDLPRELADAAQKYRGEYKDFLTDRALGELFNAEDERSAHIRHRELRKLLVELAIEVNTSHV
jgi:hypothetical protein